MKFECAGCCRMKPREEFHEFSSSDRRRPVTSRCRACRREDYYRKTYPNEVCAACQLHRPLDQNQVCRGCNEEMGLRACRAEACHPAGELLPLFLKFYGRSRVCKDCQKHAKMLHSKGGRVEAQV